MTTIPAQAAAPIEPAADSIPVRAFAPFLAAGVILALAYGSSFLLADALRAAGREPAEAGAIIGGGVATTMLGSLFAGWLAERVGLMPLIAASGLVMAGAMACFSFAGIGWVPYLGGLLLGLGWSLFYVLAPVQLIQSLAPRARLGALTFMSGAQMLGLGMAAPLGHALGARFGGTGFVYAVYAALCVFAAALALVARRAMADTGSPAMALTPALVMSILRSRAAAPTLMIGLAGGVFSSLSTFQTLYAESRGLSPQTFFIAFTLTSGVLRLSVATLIGRLPLGPFAVALFAVMMAGVALLYANAGSFALYVAATVVFATGYGLTYSTLNAMAVNLAGARGLSVSIASQVFTLGYFIGLFGFPFAEGGIIHAHGIDAALIGMMGLIAANILIGSGMLARRAV
jgi:hypothetical protein